MNASEVAKSLLKFAERHSIGTCELLTRGVLVKLSSQDEYVYTTIGTLLNRGSEDVVKVVGEIPVDCVSSFSASIDGDSIEWTFNRRDKS